jgi:neutral ceramidase
MRAVDWRTAHGPKVRFFDLGRGAAGRICKVFSTMPPGFGLLRDRRVEYYRQVLTGGKLGNSPWVPQVLPIQILRIGSLAIVGLPVEPTTVSGRRLRAAVAQALARAGVDRVVINAYANAYASYVATFEEYQAQLYEGASTLFGQWTLGAFCTELRSLARHMAGSRRAGAPNERPPLAAETGG